MSEKFAEMSDESLIDTYQQVKDALDCLDEARTNLIGNTPPGTPYGVFKGVERLEQGGQTLRDELQSRDIDPDAVVVE